MFTAFYSFDNIHWLQIGGSQNIAMSTTVKAGLAVTSGDDGAFSTGIFSHVTVADPRNFVIANNAIGSPGNNGSLTYSQGNYTISGGGSGIGNTSDQLQFGANGLVGDWDISARITAVDAGGTAGVMFRNDNSATASFAGVVLGPDHVLKFTWRDGSGNTQSIDGPTVSGPVWAKVTRNGSSFQGWYSSNGTDWNQIGTAQTVGMGQSALGGLAVTSNDDSVLRNATFSDLKVSRSVAINSTTSNLGNSLVPTAPLTLYRVAETTCAPPAISSISLRPDLRETDPSLPESIP
jgi:hypothetical protein